MLSQNDFDFDGVTYDPRVDYTRLAPEMIEIYEVMKDGGWYFPEEICVLTGIERDSLTARIRDFRIERNGGFNVESERVKGRLWRYRIR